MGCILLTKSYIRESGRGEVFVSSMDLVNTKTMVDIQLLGGEGGILDCDLETTKSEV